jgi:quinol monooxygenase YgiN
VRSVQASMPRIPPPTPWKSLSEPEPDHEYLVLLTHLPVRRLSKVPLFLRHTREIQKQLDAAPDGLVGYSLLAKPLRSSYWTLSVWRDRAALAAFIRQPPHRAAMESLPEVFSGFKTERWTLAGGDLPPSWDDALTRPE